MRNSRPASRTDRVFLIGVDGDLEEPAGVGRFGEQFVEGAGKPVEAGSVAAAAAPGTNAGLKPALVPGLAPVGNESRHFLEARALPPPGFLVRP